ncbi:hypothetical protein BWI96_08345 [Siphonobacter sp. SORGH_AS_0500]|uniref:hypothetical protein n=1 Tax=Siphonobacter sp. SORGH_AS_0500 TaxID=1864824 RepID=UPI000CBA8C84|nr:hypothetical protein [Siphonobacter sp. SORGH_AS_0500]PKK36895.1 hypothetical protein BWI96_08345 [Siphonobacter sp. SORGH_AS_0500]
MTSNAFKTDLNLYGPEFNYPTSMYYYGLLIDPSSADGSPYYGTGRDQITGERINPTDQSFSSVSTGYTNQWSFSYGANYMNNYTLG